ncbi:MAG: 50S ribosomal protein L25 [Acidobacteria bacterium]|nr:50S ribosomal protein L25 [Acidobacteriota bacterium]
MQEVVIEVQRREQTGKNANRRLRAGDLIPAVVYGGGREPIAVQVPKKMLLALFKEGGHENRIFLLKLAGTDQSRHAMVRDLQIDPATHQVEHLDFQRVMMDQNVRVKVHVELKGTPNGVKNQGGVLDFMTRDLEVECLPSAIPHEITVDVSDLQVGDHIEAKDLNLPEGVAFVGAPDAVIVAVSHARVESTEATEAAAEAEGAEPEVIKRGKEGDEEED